MNDTHAEVRIRRVVACFAAGHGTRAEGVARLARELEADFLALFIEDADLVRLASLPFACEIGIASISPLVLEVGLLNRQLRAQADRVEQALLATFGSRSGWRFRIERATPASAVAVALAESGEPALLVPPGGNARAERRLARRSELTPALIRGLLAERKPIVVMPD